MKTDLLFDTLEDLLAYERRTILAGDLDRLPPLLHEKERMIHAISAVNAASSDRIDHIRSLIAYNRSLLDSALDGMRAAMRRLGTRQHARHTLSTYDNTGARNDICHVDHRLEQRR